MLINYGKIIASKTKSNQTKPIQEYEIEFFNCHYTINVIYKNQNTNI